MKILKPGKVEMRKFVCEKCGCEFVADKSETKYSLGYYVSCPLCSHLGKLWWENGEPYEEPVQDLEADRERLIGLIHEWDTKYFGGCNAAVEFLLENGVTFREV